MAVCHGAGFNWPVSVFIFEAPVKVYSLLIKHRDVMRGLAYTDGFQNVAPGKSDGAIKLAFLKKEIVMIFFLFIFSFY